MPRATARSHGLILRAWRACNRTQMTETSSRGTRTLCSTARNDATSGPYVPTVHVCGLGCCEIVFYWIWVQKVHHHLLCFIRGGGVLNHTREWKLLTKSRPLRHVLLLAPLPCKMTCIVFSSVSLPSSLTVVTAS